MALSRPGGWAGELERWLAPFLAALSRPEQRRWAPVYLEGLLLPGERKSVEPMAARVAPGEVQQLHHFVAASPWAAAPLEAELVRAADRLVGGPDAVLVVDDTALVKQGAHSVGVQRQYCGELGKKANCQALVSPSRPRRARAVAPAGTAAGARRQATPTARRRSAGCPRSTVETAAAAPATAPPTAPRRVAPAASPRRARPCRSGRPARPAPAALRGGRHRPPRHVGAQHRPPSPTRRGP